MRKPESVDSLTEFGRVRLSKTFFMRDFLYSEISQIEGIPNIPDYPDRAIEAGRGLCEQLLDENPNILKISSNIILDKTKWFAGYPLENLMWRE